MIHVVLYLEYSFLTSIFNNLSCDQFVLTERERERGSNNTIGVFFKYENNFYQSFSLFFQHPREKISIQGIGLFMFWCKYLTNH